MTMRTRGQAHRRKRTRSSKRDALIYGFAGIMFGFVFVMAVPTADTWLTVLGTCFIAFGAVMYIVKAIVALRADEYVPDE